MIIEIKQCNWDAEIKCINVLMLLTLYHVVSRDNRIGGQLALKV